MKNLSEKQRTEIQAVMDAFKEDIGRVQYDKDTFEDYMKELAPDTFKTLEHPDLLDIADHYKL